MKSKFPRSIAIEVAKELQPVLEPVTERLMCCGSLRRMKPEVGDLELLIVPKTMLIPDGFFDTVKTDLAAQAVDKLLEKGVLTKRPNINGHFAWGPLNKLALHTRTGLGVDIFSTSESHWYVSVVIRTGPADWNVRLIQALAKHGYNLHAYGSASITDKNGDEVPVRSEQEVFTLAGWPWIEPKDRRV